MPVVSGHVEDPQITIQTSTVFEVMASLRSLQLGAIKERPPYMTNDSLSDGLAFFYGNFDYGAQLAELAIDYRSHDSFEGFLSYVKNMDIQTFLYYIFGRYLSIQEIADARSRGKWNIEQIAVSLKNKGGMFTEEHRALLTDPDGYKDRLLQLWTTHWQWLKNDIPSCKRVWSEATDRIYEALETMDWRNVVEFVLQGRQLPAQFPTGTILNKLTLIPSSHMSLRYFIIWGYGSSTVIFDAKRILEKNKLADTSYSDTLDISETLRKMNALSERTRVEILSHIYHRPDIRAVDITQLLGLSAASVSKHLSVLRDAGLVKEIRREKGITFEILEESLIQSSADIMHWIRTSSLDS